MKNAYFAGGCFWCITPIFKLYGATNVICGYAGGKEENPTYEEVKKQKTGHRETICVEYDPATVTYEQLLEIYLANVDPFDAEGQFIDKGFSYTLAIFYMDEEERLAAEKAIKKLEKKKGKKAAIALLPFTNFFVAEEYHQDYYLKNPEAFEKELVESGRKKAQKHYCYMLRCADGSLYTGYTTDPKRREKEHNSPGSTTKYTRARQPVKMVYLEEFSTKEEAMEREYFIKHHLTRKQKEELLPQTAKLDAYE